jgi:hypothetical protein
MGAKLIFFVLTFVLSITSFGQGNQGIVLVDAKIAKMPLNLCKTTDGIASFIKNNFKSEDEKIRAVFYWTASTITYDYKNRLTIDFNTTTAEKINNALTLKKGVCIHYAEVFNEIANKVGVKSYVIEGYTKQNGKTATESHAWCAAQIGGVWWFFDPTWGAGYVDKGVFFKKINNYYFKIAPNKLITSHVSFDYLWQFLNYPVSNKEFMLGKIQSNKTKSYFDFISEISRYEGLSDIDKATESMFRIEKNGLSNPLVRDAFMFKKKELEMYRNNDAVSKIDSINSDYNQAIVFFNDFIQYRNKHFKPALSDQIILEMITTPKNKFLDCQKRIYGLGLLDPRNVAIVKSLQSLIEDMVKQTKEQEKFVVEYLSKSKLGRKTMFNKFSFFGLPLN